MIFKLSDKEFKRISDMIMKDVGEDIRDELRDEFAHLESYYEKDTINSIVYDDTDHVVGSEHWGVAAVDNGSDWHWSKFPNIDKLQEWVRKDKDNGKWRGAPDYIVKQIAYKVGRKIMKDGIQPTFFVDSIMGIYNRQVTLDT